MDSVFKVSYYFREVTLQIQYSFLPKSKVFLITYIEEF